MNTQRIQDRLKEMNMSVYRLAKETGLPNSTVCEIVRGDNKNPKILTAKRIADALGLTLDDLVATERS